MDVQPNHRIYRMYYTHALCLFSVQTVRFLFMWIKRIYTYSTWSLVPERFECAMFTACHHCLAIVKHGSNGKFKLESQNALLQLCILVHAQCVLHELNHWIFKWFHIITNCSGKHLATIRWQNRKTPITFEFNRLLQHNIDRSPHCWEGTRNLIHIRFDEIKYKSSKIQPQRHPEERPTTQKIRNYYNYIWVWF